MPNPERSPVPFDQLRLSQEQTGYAPVAHGEIRKHEIKYDFSHGENSLGTPFDEDTPKQQEEQRQKELAYRRTYPNPEIQQWINETLKQREKLKTASVFTTGVGSDRYVTDITQKLVKNNTMLLTIGPHFPGWRNAAAQREGPLRYKVIEHPDMDFEDSIYMLMNDPAFLHGSPKLIPLTVPTVPTGEVFKNGIFRELGKAAYERGHIVVFDEAFGGMLEPDESAVSLTDELPNIIVLQTTSKFWGIPGDSTGIAYVSNELAQAFGNIQLPYNLRGTPLAVMEGLLKYDRMDRFKARVLPQNISAKSAFIQALNNNDIKVAPTDLRTLPLAIYGFDDNLREQLLKEFGILTVGFADFGETYKMASNELIRATVQDPEANAYFVQSMVTLRDRHIAKFLSGS